MAWYKDPVTGEVIEVNLFEKKYTDSGMPVQKSVQSQMLVVPFSVPYKTENPEKMLDWDSLYGVTPPPGKGSATWVAEKKGYDALWVDPDDKKTVWGSWMPWNIAQAKTFDVFFNAWTRPYVTLDSTMVHLWSSINMQANVVTPQQYNITKFSDDTEHKFTENVTDINADPFRALTHLGCLVEEAPKGSGYFHENAQYSSNRYRIDSQEDFKIHKSNSLFKSEIVDYEKQYKNRLKLRKNKVRFLGGPAGTTHPLYNPIFNRMWLGQDGSKWDSLNGNGSLKSIFFQSTNKPYLNKHSHLAFPLNYKGVSYKDSTFEIVKPSLERAYQSNVGEEMGLSTPVKVQAHYNYYLVPYEKAISDYQAKGEMQVRIPHEFKPYKDQTLIPIPEQLLPNIYALVYDQMSEEPYFRYGDQGSWIPPLALKNIEKENGSLKLKAGDDIQYGNHQFLVETLGQFLSVTTKKNNINETPVKNIPEYLNSWANMLGILNSDTPDKAATYGSHWAPAFDRFGHRAKSAAAQIMEKKYNVVGVSAYKLKDLNDEAEKLKKQFPFYVDIDIPMSNEGVVGQTLYESGLTDIFMQNCMAAYFTVYNKKDDDNKSYQEASETNWPIHPNIVQSFYKDIKVGIADSHANVCMIRKDMAPETQDGVLKIAGQQHTMFNETLLQLWLNPLLESKHLLDLDQAPAVDIDKNNDGDKNFLAEAYSGLPPHLYEWINYFTASDYVKQIIKLKGHSGAGSGQWYHGGNKLNILKPVIFGKKAVASNAQSIVKWHHAKKTINKFINDRVRSVDDIFRGKKAYSEVLFYEVVKYASIGVSETKTSNQWGNKPINHPVPQQIGYVPDWSVGHGQPIDHSQNVTSENVNPPDGGPSKPAGQQGWIQSFFVPNVPGMDIAKYVDTQVKNDKGYYYQVYAHTFVIGTKYQNTNWYGDCNWDNNDKEPFFDLMMEYDYKPDVQLFRVPFYNTIATSNNSTVPTKDPNQTYNIDIPVWGSLETTLVWDSPPIFPDAVFIPFYGENDRVLINCNFNSGQYELTPVDLETVEYLGGRAKARISQKKLNGPITFASDDFCGEIEILRIDKKPNSYEDFTPVSETKIASVGGGKSNFGFIDNALVPNKDYYYIVREKDVHGNYSNPSPVYYARIVHKEAEAPYTIFKMYFMEELQDKKLTSTKEFMKYIKIKPSLKQRILNDGEITEYSYVNLLAPNDNLNEMVGKLNLDKNIWGQKFKFRFTSKKTGRKFDLNLTVKDIKKIEKETKHVAGEPDTFSSGKC
tara:strand:- start:12830 stop:16630 length:3801 start_codon:yes stop_codon:yes gene_type:complete